MSEIKTEIINTTKQIGDLLDWLILRHRPPSPIGQQCILIDLEGVNLSREGSISIFTLLIDTGLRTLRVCLIDVYSLVSEASNTTGIKGQTLKDILQAENIPKIFFDVRNDADALFAHFGVALRGLQDVQLMESATRTTTSSRKYLNGLAKCVDQYALFNNDLASWKLAKEKGLRLFNPEYGGSYEIFEQRPILDEIISYCVGDVQHLPKLWQRFQANTSMWREMVNKETEKRVEASHKPEYQPHGTNRTLAPWTEDQNRILNEWNYVPAYNFSSEDNSWDFGRDDSWDDDGPTSCRDIINNSDYELYYSD